MAIAAVSRWLCPYREPLMKNGRVLSWHSTSSHGRLVTIDVGRVVRKEICRTQEERKIWLRTNRILGIQIAR